jgi:hypothetical protein
MESASFEIYLHPELNCDFHRDDVRETRACSTVFFYAKNSYTEFCGRTSPLHNTFFLTS